MARYELKERIGVGGMAEIFRGMAVAGGGFEKPVAIKRILPHLSQDRRFVELLITEAKTLSQLRHRNIVQIYDVGLGDDGQYFLVMEYVDGIDLCALFDTMEQRRQKFPLDVALHLGAEVCEALDHAHRAHDADGKALGLVHRDVSPSNVLLSRSGEVKLTDFGIAKRMEEATGHGGVRGKFAYISPEQAANAHVDARSDVFSLGIVLFELVTARRLFSGMPDFDALRAVRDGVVPRLRSLEPSLDDELDEMLATALDADPDRRFPTAAAFASQLRGYRYSMDSTLADPSSAIAGLVATSERPHSEPEPLFSEAERTVVRISTAAGFSAEFEDGALAEPPRPGRSRTRSRDRGLPVDEDAETKALDVSRLPDYVPPQPAIASFDDEAETRLLERPDELARAQELEFQPTAPVVSLPGPAQVAALPSGPERRPDALGGSGRVPVRAATPTVRELFYSGELLETDYPRAVAAPQRAPSSPSALEGEKSRRRLLIAGGVAAVLAIAAFVVAGAVLAGGPATAPASVTAQDGGVGAALDARGASGDERGGRGDEMEFEPDEVGVPAAAEEEEEGEGEGEGADADADAARGGEAQDAKEAVDREKPAARTPRKRTGQQRKKQRRKRGR